MKMLDITIKDMRQAFRSLVALVFMFAIPILITFLFFLMFGDAGGDGAFEVPRSAVLIVNLDEGQMQTAGSEASTLPDSTIDLANVGSMGELLTQILQDEGFADLMDLSIGSDETAARRAVDNADVDVAIIIPSGFTDALFEPESTAELILYQDPTLTLGPAIVESILSQLVDGFAASKIGIGVTMEQLALNGVPITPELAEEVVASYTAEALQQGQARVDQPAILVAIQSPSGVEEETNIIGSVLAVIMGGMLVFFAFFTGASTMQTILTEDEKGTLSRLFTTPTSHLTILGGKTLSTFITLSIQVTVLLLFGWLVFDIDWGDPLPVVMAAVGLIIVAGTFGLFLVSLMKDTRQAGLIFGGLLTVLGMMGLITVFTIGVPNISPAVNMISLLVPQGWAVRGLQSASERQSMSEMWLVFGITLLWSLLFALIGQYRMRRRYN